MTQGSYIPENTQDLIRRAEITLGNTPVLDLTNPQYPTYMPVGGQIRSLSPSCNHIEVRNTITVTDSSIVRCTAPATATCESIPATCSAIAPGDHINMVATVNALVAQNGVTIRFEYLENDVPAFTDVTVNLSAGNNTVYAWSPNHVATVGYTLSLYGARVISS